MLARICRTLPVIVLAGVMASCGDDDSPTGPTTPPPIITEPPFTGTVNPNGARTHTFTTQASGTVTATLTTLSPDSALIIGFSLGTWNGTFCQTILFKDDATQGTVITGGVSSGGLLCARIYDVGNIPANTLVSYEITVTHP